MLRIAILRRFRLYRQSRRDLLQVTNDDPVTFIHALVYDNQTAIGGAGRDNALLGLAVIADDVNEPAELARTQRDLWHQQGVGLVGDADTHMDELSRVGGGDHHLGWRDIGKLRDWQQVVRDEPGQYHDDG